jgi:serine/threonine-protein kinase HipA
MNRAQATRGDPQPSAELVFCRYRFTGAPVQAVFDNLLPDNPPIRRKIAERLGAPGEDVFSLLTVIGRDCVGALQLLPEGQAPGPAGAVAGKRVSRAAIARRIRNLANAPLGLDDEDDGFRISIAGAQEKTALLRWRGWRIPSGVTATTHILKAQIGRIRNEIDLSQSVENAYLSMNLARELGLPVADVEIEDFDGTRVLVVERFDRQWSRDGKRLLRVPQEDMCQAFAIPSSMKYERDGGPGIRAILQLLQGSDDPETDQRLFLRAQLVFWLLGATDGHAKNFSIHLLSGARFRLAPFYDIMPSSRIWMRNRSATGRHASPWRSATGVITSSTRYCPVTLNRLRPPRTFRQRSSASCTTSSPTRLTMPSRRSKRFFPKTFPNRLRNQCSPGRAAGSLQL